MIVPEGSASGNPDQGIRMCFIPEKISGMKQSFILLAFLLITSTIGCRKDKDDEKKSVCRITRLTDAMTGLSHTIIYNTEGGYQSIKREDGKHTINFEYAGNTIISQIYDANNKLIRKATMVLNNKGMIWFQMGELFDASGNITNNWSYTYEYNEEQLIKSTYNIIGTTPRISTYAWSGDNNTEVTDDVGRTTYYEYYTDKADQQGDYWNLRMLYLGIDQRLITRTKNLFKGFRGYDQFTYEFDSQGNITSVSEDGQLIYTLQYVCN